MVSKFNSCEHEGGFFLAVPDTFHFEGVMATSMEYEGKR